MTINENSRNNSKVQKIRGSETSVEVDIPVVFADNIHSRFRQNTRGVNSDVAVSLVKQVLPAVLDATVKNNITKTQDGKPFFSVIDKQSCTVVGCTMEGKGTNNLKQFITIRTVFVRDQYHKLDDKISKFYVNENNPSEKWEEAEYYSKEYGNSYSGFRNYEKSFDPEHKKEFDKEKRDQMNKLWAMREPNRLGDDYDNAKNDALSQTRQNMKKYGMDSPQYNLDRAMSDADKKILTNRGTNGTLRGIDRRNNAAKRNLRNMVREAVENYLKESVLIPSIPDDIKQAVLQNRTSLGNNPAIPDIYDIPYILKVVNAEFESAKDSLKSIGSIDGVDESSLESALASLIHKCEEIERPYRSELEKICFNYVIELFSVPEDAVDLSMTLTDKVDTNKESVILDPADGDEDMEFDDLGDAMAIKGEVYKRRFLDAVCMGIGLDFSYSIDESVLHQIDEINPELRKLYTEITALNNYLLFTKEDLGMTDDNNLQMGTFELRLGNEETKCSIESQGVIFPFLLCETIRGFMDLFISHGLPKERNRAISVLGKSDFLKAEPWDMRLGRHMWNMVRKSLNDISFDYIPYLFKRLSSLETDKFNFLMKEVLAGTKKGRRIMAYICNKAKDDSEYDKFVDRMDKMKKDKGIITDDYIHPEEL